MNPLLIPGSADLLTPRPVYGEEGTVGDGFELTVAGTTEHADWLHGLKLYEPVYGPATTAAPAMFPLIRRLYATKGLASPV